jgi:hypothetical protein
LRSWRRASARRYAELAFPIEVRNPGQLPLLVPGALRFPLLTLLLSHPDAAAVDALLNGLVI